MRDMHRKISFMESDRLKTNFNKMPADVECISKTELELKQEMIN